MSTQNCECGDGVGNLGDPICTQKAGRGLKLVYVSLKDGSGVANKIASTDIVSQSYLDALVNNIDNTKRWHVTPKITNFLSAKADAVFQTADNGEKTFLREGIRTFTGLFLGADSPFIKDANKVKCTKAGFYIITENNNIQGYAKDETGDIYPIPVSILINTLDMENGTENQDVSFVLDIPITVLDCAIATLYGAAADLIGASGLVQLSATATIPAALAYTLTLNNGGAYGSTLGLPGLVIADLIAFNETTQVAATVASVTATAVIGVYLVAFTGAVSTNVVKVSESALLTSSGFSFNSVQLAVL